jgi:hypothetical protein
MSTTTLLNSVLFATRATELYLDCEHLSPDERKDHSQVLSKLEEVFKGNLKLVHYSHAKFISISRKRRSAEASASVSNTKPHSKTLEVVLNRLRALSIPSLI